MNKEEIIFGFTILILIYLIQLCPIITFVYGHNYIFIFLYIIFLILFNYSFIKFMINYQE